MDITKLAALLDQARQHRIRLWVDHGQLRYEAIGPERMVGSVLAQLRERRGELIEALSGPNYERREGQRGGPILAFYQTYWQRIRAGALHPGVLNATHTAMKVFGTIDVSRLEASFNALIGRHAILRARVVPGAEGFEFVFDRAVALRIEDLSHIEPRERQALALQKAQALIWTAFDVDAEPLFRPFLIQLSHAESIIGFVVHHFICDRVSILTMLRELANHYEGGSCAGEALALQYTDYIAATNEWLGGMNAQLRLHYWKQRLRGAPAIRITPDYAPEASAIGTVNIERFVIAAPIVQSLQRLSVASRTTLFVIVLTATATVLSHLLECSDVTVLSMHEGRDDPQLQAMVGATMRRLAVRCSVPLSAPFQEVVQAVRESWLADSENLIPYRLIEPVLEEIGAGKSFPLINFVSSNAASWAAAGARLRIKPLAVPAPIISGTATRFSNFWMAVNYDGVRIEGQLGYSSLLYSSATFAHFLSLLNQVLTGAGEDPTRTLASLLTHQHTAVCVSNET